MAGYIQITRKAETGEQVDALAGMVGINAVASYSLEQKTPSSTFGLQIFSRTYLAAMTSR
jgi:hypothetical protein